jgi:hypothetical protein
LIERHEPARAIRFHIAHNLIYDSSLDIELGIEPINVAPQLIAHPHIDEMVGHLSSVFASIHEADPAAFRHRPCLR